jgi:hypothetical protein
MHWKIRLATAAVCLAAPACASAAQQAAGLCSGSGASAQNQYCEVVPTATGGHGPTSASRTPTGAPPIASSLPASTVRALSSPRAKARHRLLKLPGRSVTQPLRGSGSVSQLSLLLPLILVLLAVAALMALEVARRRRGAHAT